MDESSDPHVTPNGETLAAYLLQGFSVERQEDRECFLLRLGKLSLRVSAYDPEEDQILFHLPASLEAPIISGWMMDDPSGSDDGELRERSFSGSRELFAFLVNYRSANPNGSRFPKGLTVVETEEPEEEDWPIEEISPEERQRWENLSTTALYVGLLAERKLNGIRISDGTLEECRRWLLAAMVETSGLQNFQISLKAARKALANPRTAVEYRRLLRSVSRHPLLRQFRRWVQET
jgi:hypothetical protein